MTKQRRTFSPEFKLHIVQLIRDQGLSITQVCKDQSLGQSTIHRWLAQYDAELSGERVQGAIPITADQRRIRELEQHNKRLQEDIAILKKLPPSSSNKCADLPSHDLYCPRRLRQTASLRSARRFACQLLPTLQTPDSDSMRQTPAVACPCQSLV